MIDDDDDDDDVLVDLLLLLRLRDEARLARAMQNVPAFVARIYPDSRDFGGFLLDRAPTLFRRLTDGMGHEWRTRLAIEHFGSAENLLTEIKKRDPYFYRIALEQYDP